MRTLGARRLDQRLLRPLPETALPLDRRPFSPSRWDDEFESGSLSPKWTSPAVATSGVDLTVNDGYITWEPDTAGSGSTGKRGGWGLRQPAPSGSFSVMACVQNQTTASDDTRCGVFIGKLGSIAVMVGPYQGTVNSIGIQGYSRTADWGSWDQFNVGQSVGWSSGWDVVWCRLDYDAAADTVDFLYSANGRSWLTMSSDKALGAPDDVGIAFWSNTAVTNADHTLNAYWFRVVES